MRKLLLFSCLVLLHCYTFSQVHFQMLSFEEAIQQAARTGRYVLVQLDSKECQHCNEVATKGFADKKISEKLVTQFISIRPAAESTDWQELCEQYELPKGLAILVFNSDGILLGKHNGATSNPKLYEEVMAKAAASQLEIANIETLTRSFSLNKDNIVTLQSLMQKRKELYLSTDSLLDMYVTLLPEDSLHSVSQLQFIAHYAPVLGSRADSMMRLDRERYSEAWYRMEHVERVSINRNIIYKSRQQAIAGKNLSLAMRVASFAAGVNSIVSDRPRIYAYNLMVYYLGVKDTDRYLRYAVNYYNRYRMNVSVDSVLQKDSIAKSRLLADMKRTPVKKENGATQYTGSITFQPSAQFYAIDLNAGAWNVYKMTNDSVLLKMALKWAERANKFFANPSVMDTYARLLYKTGNHTEAIRWQENAVALSKKRGYGEPEMQAVLDNMKQERGKIDSR